MKCLAVVLINISGLPWVAQDSKNLSVAKVRCKIVKPASPCLGKFIKVRKLTYRAVCQKGKK